MSEPVSDPSSEPSNSSRLDATPQPHRPLPLNSIRSLQTWLKSNQDPSTLPFLRAYALGYAASVVPELLGVLLTRRKRRAPSPHHTNAVLAVLRDVIRVLSKGFGPQGYALAFGVAVGGAKWGERRVEPLVRLSVQAIRKARSDWLRKRQHFDEVSAAEQQYKLAKEAVAAAKDERMIKALSTFVSGAMASLISICLLQLSSGTPSRLPASSPTFYGPADPLSSPALPAKKQSPTLDITIFILVRAIDSIVRGVDDHTGASAGKKGRLVAFLANHADTAVFWASCWRIMWCWFYLPQRLPPSYNRWISRLARVHPRLLHILQAARNGSFTYGKMPSPYVDLMCTQIAYGTGVPISSVQPHLTSRLPCDIVHGHVGGPGTCEMNALKRWVQGFKDSLMIYLPVHFIPHLLFNFGGFSAAPVATVVKILLAASRSSAFLATFLASIFASYAAMDEIVPAFLATGRTGVLLGRWIERSIFALSTGTVIATCVHRPELVSGIVRGFMVTAVGDWSDRPKTVKASVEEE